MAEEATNVLNQRDDILAQQLITAIEQTNSSHRYEEFFFCNNILPNLTPYSLFTFSEIKSEYVKDESDATDAPLMLKLIQASRPNVFNSNVYNQKYGKWKFPRFSFILLSLSYHEHY